MTSPAIRPARLSDGEQLLPLLHQLGYPTSGEEVSRRLARLIQAPSVGVLVAADHEGSEVIGLGTFQIIELLERPAPQCRITALVVRADHRRRGIGAALVEAIAEVARQRGCFRLELTTRPDRQEALPFYTALGFTVRPHRLVMDLDRE
ncbi:MAG: GNAT family N-acetyltransferase [Solirubrobacterales bacterium]|nr:GNAT family N-acetyltransferase [Solirubrobacterales bacterium]MBV8943433.1 GNAT family N-acetyltransferase [Solirubrobacterales bacterium]MBV9533809.1 GNAT family N-acetyltransferase [Solirubrobacterales bacterium]